MNKEVLEAKKAQLTDKFNTISKQVNDLNIELRRLEGGYAAINELIDELDRLESQKTKEVKNGRK